ncbi:hypothetical protein [Providencia sp. PROV130]|uniref:hypothetical protein n=1 Tax=Providencia sp. PROV130 TaxID=2949840 RepID=UPI0023495C03|nr:hypothetical protein [Providencia sp. PROV130]
MVSEHQLTHKQLAFITARGTSWQETAALKIYQNSSALTLHNLVVCQLPLQPTGSTSFHERTSLFTWQREIIRSQLEWIALWTKVLIEHAAQRKVGSSTLLSVPSIRLRLGQVIQHHALLEQCLIMNNWSVQQSLTEIERMVDALIKTAGGRAMMQHGLVEMNSLFTVLNQIYLGADHDEF